MASTLTIRNVPEETHRVLAARAAARGQSLQEYLLFEMTELARKPSVQEVLDRARARAAGAGTRLTTDEIVEAVRADRDR